VIFSSLSSISQYAGPMLSVYAGTKAFVQCFSESVAAEVENDGIDVLSGFQVIIF
jgi:short-subunit dehydrogenase